jgi:hypothetical protein
MFICGDSGISVFLSSSFFWFFWANQKTKRKKKAMVRSIKSFWGKKTGPKSAQYEDLKKYKIAIFRQ